jgi:hypothetical protein
MHHELPCIIDAPGRYETRCGEIVAIETIDKIPGTDIPRTRYYACRGYYTSTFPSPNIAESWHVSGRLYPRIQSPNDIVRKCESHPL